MFYSNKKYFKLVSIAMYVFVVLLIDSRSAIAGDLYFVNGFFRGRVAESSWGGLKTTIKKYKILGYIENDGKIYELPQIYQKVDRYFQNTHGRYVCVLNTKGRIPFWAIDEETNRAVEIRPDEVTFECDKQ